MPDVTIDPLCSLICPRCGSDRLMRLAGQVKSAQVATSVQFQCDTCEADSTLILIDQPQMRTAVVWKKA